MTLKAAITAFSGLLLWGGPVVSADLATVPSPQEDSGIWAAIAYSSTDREHGIFWGADTRQEAMDNALEHCGNTGGKACEVVVLFRNHRHRDDDDQTGFPYRHCGALAVGEVRPGRPASWGAEAAPTRQDAEDLALKICEQAGEKCSIREWLCT